MSLFDERLQIVKIRCPIEPNIALRCPGIHSFDRMLHRRLEEHACRTWADINDHISEAHLLDSCKVGSGSDFTGETIGSFRGDGTYPGVEKAAYAVSQYFTMGEKEIQIRTSGYCKFSDVELDPAVRDGSATIDVTGVLTMYQGSVQFVINNISDIIVNK